MEQLNHKNWGAIVGLRPLIGQYTKWAQKIKFLISEGDVNYIDASHSFSLFWFHSYSVQSLDYEPLSTVNAFSAKGLSSECSYTGGSTEDQKTMENLESRRRFVLEQRHFFYFLGIGSKELSFSRTHGEQDLGSTGKYSWCGFITVFENNSHGKNILQINIHNCGILLFYITHASASFL